MNNITYAVSVDVNNPIIPYNVYVANVLDSNVRYLEITLYENGNVITLSNTATATASLVTDNVLVDDSVECTISDNIITVPLEDLQRHGNLDVQVTVTEGTKVLAIPFPIQVRVTPNIAENAQIDENSLGSYAEVVQEIAEARGDYTTLQAALAAKANAAPGSIDETNLSFTPVKYVGSNDLDECINSGVLYHVHDGSAYQLVICSLGTYAKTQYMFTQRGTVKSRTMIGENAWSSWSPIGKNENLADKSITVEKVADDLAGVINAKEVKSNKKTTLSGNESSNVFYPTTKAVADALSTKAPISTAFTFDTSTEAVPYNVNNPKIIYLNALANNKKAIVLTSADNYYQIAICFDGSEYSRQLMGSAANTYSPWTLNASEDTNNKKNEITDANKSSTVFYPSVKAVVDYLTANYLTASETNTSLAGKESISNRLTSSEGIDINSTDAEYPTGKAVFDFVSANVDDINANLALKENASNRKDTLSGYESSDAYYPSTKAVADALSAKAPASTAYNFDTTTTELTFANSSPSVIYLNATVDGEKGIVITAANRVCQYFLGTGSVKIRVQNGASSFSDWQAIFEIQFNKKSSITDSNKTSTTSYPSIKATVDYVDAQIQYLAMMAGVSLDE